MNIKDGYLTPARQIASPNFDGRPEQSPVSLIVIHCMSLPPEDFQQTEDIDALFTNCLDTSKHPFYEALKGVKVSVHFLIDRLGRISQYVSTDQRAWHAGQSVYKEVENCNNYSIGIELQGSWLGPFEDEQYTSLLALIKVLQLKYPAINLNITGHEHIAPGRKLDPGPFFDWSRLRSLGLEVPA